MFLTREPALEPAVEDEQFQYCSQCQTTPVSYGHTVYLEEDFKHELAFCSEDCQISWIEDNQDTYIEMQEEYFHTHQLKKKDNSMDDLDLQYVEWICERIKLNIETDKLDSVTDMYLKSLVDHCKFINKLSRIRSDDSSLANV